MSQAGVTCPHCKQGSFQFDDIGHLEDGQLQAGVYVAAHDDGQAAGNMAGTITSSSRSNISKLIAINRERLDAGMSYLQLPQHLATAARQLLASVIETNRSSEHLRPTTPVTLAGTLYLAAREQGYALSLGAAGAAFSTNPIYVGREFRNLVALLKLPMPPPNLESLVLHAASVLLPHFYQHEQPLKVKLRQEPVVKTALDLARLIKAVGATDGRSPAVAAEHFRDAKPTAYAVQVAGLLQHDRSRVQQHIRNIEQHLLPLLPLLPFAKPNGSNSGVECVKYAGTLLKLQHLSQEAVVLEKKAGAHLQSMPGSQSIPKGQACESARATEVAARQASSNNSSHSLSLSAHNSWRLQPPAPTNFLPARLTHLQLGSCNPGAGRAFTPSQQLVSVPWWLLGGIALAGVSAGAVAAVYGVCTYVMKTAMVYSFAWKAATGVAAAEGLAIGGWGCSSVRAERAAAAESAAALSRVRKEAERELAALRGLLRQKEADNTQEVAALSALNEKLTRLAHGLRDENAGLHSALDQAAYERKSLEAAAALEHSKAESSALVGAAAAHHQAVLQEVSDLARGQQQLVALVCEVREELLGLVGDQASGSIMLGLEPDCSGGAFSVRRLNSVKGNVTAALAATVSDALQL
eukprot:gene5233-5469_t